MCSNKTKTRNSKPKTDKPAPFEVHVDGALVHSRMGGDGFVDSMPKFNSIVREVEAALEGKGISDALFICFNNQRKNSKCQMAKN